jgi:outer membrane lipoprotein-sorting protein
MYLRFPRICAAALVAVCVAAPALPQAPMASPVKPAITAPKALTASERAGILKAAAKTLSAIKTARGNFEQVAPDQSLTTGRFALSRPGKIRFEYAAPSALLIVSDGATVALQDPELETTERLPLGATPLALLLDDKLDFEKKAKVQDVRRSGDDVSITLTDAKGNIDGTLTLFLTGKTQVLTGWRTVDSAGNATSVKLSAVEYGKKLNARLFVIAQDGK